MDLDPRAERLPTVIERRKALLRLRQKVSCAGNVLQDIAEARFESPWRAFLTLTYADVSGWKPGHIKAFVAALRSYLARRKVPLLCVWVAELQKRGAVHFHLIVWLPKGVMLPKPDEQGWWPHGMSNVQAHRNRGVGYLLKYLSKTNVYQCFPKGCRKFGILGAGSDGGAKIRFASLPGYVKRQTEWFFDLRRDGDDWVSLTFGHRFSGWNFYRENFACYASN